ncbi:hypothetical protein RJT34_17123 [Clitoria ternatea]|uniref:Uncharacterized protein n=1 Tax=Clitoria ternatea TaxID=43366 RepID=A0AAN9J9N4_CLITE
MVEEGGGCLAKLEQEESLVKLHSKTVHISNSDICCHKIVLFFFIPAFVLPQTPNPQLSKFLFCPLFPFRSSPNFATFPSRF